ncbi:MAG: isochorismatase family cysteine hydrolase [Eubacteriales bacterium]|nr:isochorismatase family cysteine hydrolase [Eubacteriales bacterium]
MKKVLLVIDMQNDFVTDALASAEAQAIVQKVVQKVEEAQKDSETEIFFTKDTHTPDYMNTNEGKHLPVPHCIRETKGWMLIPELEKFQEDATVIEKPTFGFKDWKKVLPEDTEDITLIGVCTDICVVSNALILKALYPEVDVHVDTACCAGVTPAAHLAAIETMKSCQVDCC